MSTAQPPGDTQVDSSQRPQVPLQPSPPPLTTPVRRQAPPTVSRGLASITALDLSSPENRGYLVAGIGGIVALFAFFALPFVTVLIFSLTGMQFANSGLGASGALWLVPAAGAAALGLSVWGMIAHPPRIGASAVSGRTIALAILASGAVGALGLIILLIQAAVGLATLASSYGIQGYDIPGYGIQGALGLGFWLALLSAIAICIGGYMGYRQLRPTATPTA